ncbi:MAG: TATA-box-binding protein [Hadesarchaea archaeon]|nr:TATA-box-binding protein [Hadesarchaea archaeon]
MVDVDIEIQNIVLSVTYEGIEFDLEELASILEGARYDPEVFPGIAYKSETPRASFLIFASGKMNCVGAKSMGDAEQAIEKLTKELKDSGIEITDDPQVKVQNMVASFDFNREFDLEKIARGFRNTEYEPEVFPGLVFRLDEPEVVVLLFVSGKGVCAGAKSMKDVERAAKKITKTIK